MNPKGRTNMKRIALTGMVLVAVATCGRVSAGPALRTMGWSTC